MSHLISATSLAALFALSAGCAGSDGDPGAPGSSGGTGAPGQPGTPGSAGTIAAANAERLDITITGVTIASGKPTISFKVVDPYGKAVTGISPKDSRFSMSFLTAGTGGKSSEWRSYLRSTSNAPTGNVCPQTVATPTAPAVFGPCPNTQPVKVGTAEVAMSSSGVAAGVWTESANGVYSYTFSQALSYVGGVYEGTPYDATKTHRAGVEIRTPNPLYNASNPLNNVVRYILSNNPTYDFQPSTGATSNIERRLIVGNTGCNACHDRLTLHGEGRFDIPYCLQCHNTYSNEAAANNSIDMKVMIHKIHKGAELPSVEANKPYYIYSPYSGAVDFSEVEFPQDVRNCTTCHNESDAATPDASNWRKTVNSMTCSSCHDDLNFQTGNALHPAALDSDCATCHGPNATYDGGKWKVESVHFDPRNREAENFKIQVMKVEGVNASGAVVATCTPVAPATTCVSKVGPGMYPQVTIRIYNPKTNVNYKLTDPPFTNIGPPPPGSTSNQTPAVTAYVAWTTQNYVSLGTTNLRPVSINYLSAPVPAPNADGTYTKSVTLTAATNAIPDASKLVPVGSATGVSGAVFVGATPVMPIRETASAPAVNSRIPVPSVGGVYFPITETGTAAVARRSIIDPAKCNDCHKVLRVPHTTVRNNNPEECSACHNPFALAASGTSYPAGNPDRTFDLKYMVHRLHTGELYWNNPATQKVAFSYPGQLNNCRGCHVAPSGANSSYYPVNPALVFGTSIGRGPSSADPSDDPVVWSPNAAVCSSCHDTSTAKAHIEQNGGDFAAKASATGALISSKTETCELCHGPGRSADVKVVHDVGGFRYN